MDMKVNIDTTVINELIRHYLEAKLDKAIVLKNAQHKTGGQRESFDYYEVKFETIDKRVDMKEVVSKVERK